MLKLKRNKAWMLLAGLMGVAIPALAAKHPAEPPTDWVFPAAVLETLKPEAADVLTGPEKVTGDIEVAGTAPVIEFGMMPGQWKDAPLSTNWGDSIYGSDGNFYCSIGDHQNIRRPSFVYKI